MFREVLCTVCQLNSVSTDSSTKETIEIDFLVEHLDENTIQIFSFMILNVKRVVSILYMLDSAI